MEFVFVLGKNAELSEAELKSYLETRSLGFEPIDRGEGFIVLKLDGLPEKMMGELGGALKIGEVVFSGEDANAANFDRLFSTLPDKALFAVSAYGDRKDYVALAELLKKKLKEFGIHAGCLHLSTNESAVSHTDILKKHILEKGFEMLACRGKRFWLARTIAVHNPFEFRRHDMERPVQRAIFSIPPRLCRIMINLAKIRSGILLDPFCGIGSVLQEAALMGFDIRGEDIDESAVGGCKENLRWLEKKYGVIIDNINVKIRQGDARKLGGYFTANSVDAIVTEPYLGEPLRERPNLRGAQGVLDEVGPLFEASLKEMTAVLKPHGRIVIVSPFFDVDGKRIGLDMERLAGQNGLRLLQSIPDFEEHHRTLRLINVLVKD